jgi:hypothetical protein
LDTIGEKDTPQSPGKSPAKAKRKVHDLAVKYVNKMKEIKRKRKIGKKNSIFKNIED